MSFDDLFRRDRPSDSLKKCSTWNIVSSQWRDDSSELKPALSMNRATAERFPIWELSMGAPPVRMPVWGRGFAEPALSAVEGSSRQSSAGSASTNNQYRALSRPGSVARPRLPNPCCDLPTLARCGSLPAGAALRATGVRAAGLRTASAFETLP